VSIDTDERFYSINVDKKAASGEIGMAGSQLDGGAYLYSYYNLFAAIMGYVSRKT
jgi:hypothetical protein